MFLKIGDASQLQVGRVFVKVSKDLETFNFGLVKTIDDGEITVDFGDSLEGFVPDKVAFYGMLDCDSQFYASTSPSRQIDYYD